ncbi:50S ribosomal protein L5, partial [Candidatus Marinamargulisbacteria bacterium SCGC AG-410-N11]
VETSFNTFFEITGQKPIKKIAKKAISNFKLREGNIVGVMVTLRKKKMYDFLSKFINISLPRIRDFRGISSKSFDSRGNYNIGLKEDLVFPEVVYDNLDKSRGLNISIVTTANNDKDAYKLMDLMGFPFRKN